MTPAEELSRNKPWRRPGRNNVPQRRKVWDCRVRACRELLRLSLRDVAMATSLSIAALWQVEMGGDVMLTTATKLAIFFGKTVAELWIAKQK